jgi:hypothetical protein
MQKHKTLDVDFILQLMFKVLRYLLAVQYRIPQSFRACNEGYYPRNKIKMTIC